MAAAIASVSSGVSGCTVEREQPVRHRVHRRRSDLDVQVRAVALEQAREPAVELFHDRFGHVVHQASSHRESAAAAPARPLLIVKGTPRLQLPIFLRRQPGVRRDDRRDRIMAPRATRRQTLVRSASGSNSVRRSEGREAPSMPSSSPRWTAQTSSRCSSSRSRNGQSRREISTVLALRRRNRGSKPASASASWSTARLGPDGPRAPGRGTLRPDQVRPPLAGDASARSSWALAADQPGQDLAEQSVIASLPFLTGDRRVHHLGTADGRDPWTSLADQARLLQPAQVRAERVRVQGQARRELADRDGPTRQTQVAVEPIARVVGERLVDLDRCRFGACVQPRRMMDFHWFTPCQPE